MFIKRYMVWFKGGVQVMKSDDPNDNVMQALFIAVNYLGARGL